MTRLLARLPSALAPLAAIGLACALALVACQGQGEGQLCDTRAGGIPPGSSDCQSGLNCEQRSATMGICCPADGTSHTSACAARNSGSNNPAPSVADAAPDGAATEAAADGTLDDAANPTTGDAAAE